MSKYVISQRIGTDLVLDGAPVFEASSKVSYTQPAPATGPLTLSQAVFAGNDVFSPYWPYPLVDFNGYGDSIFVKRWRFTSNLPGAFYFYRFDTLSTYLSFLWSTNTPGFDWATMALQLQRLYTVPYGSVQFGEWQDINMFLPKSPELEGIAVGPAYGYQLGAFLPSCTFWYQNVPADIIGEAVKVRLELEIACSVKRWPWEGAIV